MTGLLHHFYSSLLKALLLWVALAASAALAQPALADTTEGSEATVSAGASQQNEEEGDLTAGTAESTDETASATDSWGDAGEGWGAPSFDYYGTLTTAYTKDDSSGLHKYEGGLAVSYTFGDYDGRFRVSNLNTYPNVKDPVRLEKCQLNGPLGRFRFSAGTFPVSTGAGLALNAFEQRELEFDTELSGFKLEYPGTDFHATVFAGEQKYRSDVSAYRVQGASVEYAVVPEWKVGGNWVGLSIPAGGTGGSGGTARTKSTAKSLTSTITWKHLSTYFEYERYQPGGGLTNGRGIYGNATLTLPGLGLTYEYKDYRGIAQRFMAPPPAKYHPEHASSDPSDEKGQGFVLSWSPFGNSSFIEASYAQANIHAGGFGYTEFLTSYHSPAESDFTYVLERQYANDGFTKDTRWRGEFSYRLAPDVSAYLMTELKHLNDFGTTHNEQTVEVDFSLGTWLTLALSQEKAPRGSASAARRWNLAELKLQRSGEQELALTYGKRRGKFACSGGLCRMEPDFDGWKLVYTRYF